MDKEAKEWATLWKETEPSVEPDFNLSEEDFVDMFPVAIDEVAASFPPNTGLCNDNIAPRAINR